ncbi:MAG: site-specific DNA-methyltransferase [Bacteroidales bacterium]|nr:site-specific DNA-methyltransferase [Bacteroidales bacterium]
MGLDDKKRAERNRTLTISQNEIPTLSRMVSSKNDVLKSGITDTIINANIMDVIDAIPDKCANLIIVDPPYNLSKDFHGVTFNAMTSDSYEKYLREWFYKICDKLSDNGTLYMCGDWKCTSSMQKVISERLSIINRITWQREKGRGAMSNWKNSMEDIWFAVKKTNDYYFNVEAVMSKRRVLAPYRDNGKPKDWNETDNGNFRTTYPSNFWDDISVPFWSMPENTDHPTQKPEKLYAKLVLASSKPGDLVFDPFLGSGTSAVVAKKLNRHYCGIEINKEYCLWAAKRIMNSETDKEIQGYQDGVFWERNTLNFQKKGGEKRQKKFHTTSQQPSLFS